MKYYLALKRKEVVTHAVRMKLEDIVLFELNQTQKDKYKIPLT